MDKQTITPSDVVTINPESLGLSHTGAMAREVPNPTLRAAAQPMIHKGEPKTARCRIRDHNPERKYVFQFSWPKLAPDGTLGAIIKTVAVPPGGEATFPVAIPPGAEVTLATVGDPEGKVTFRAEDGVTTKDLLVAWIG